MAAWLIGALALISGFVARSGGGRALARRAAPAALAGVGGAVLGAGGPGIPGLDLFPDDEKPRRRRRRRALTASDRADIAFIEATLGKAAGKSFAMIIATRG